MAVYDDFLHSLLPGNYALTKSMEITKIRDSGTLWYMKKFLTLYYYIFLTNDILTTSYQRSVIDIFDSYIASLDEDVRPRAEAYFYPNNEAINFKSENFNLYTDFASYHTFRTQIEREKYYQSAKKYYFSLLMGSGGQTGIKQKLKEAVQRTGFVYSHENIDEIILNAAIDICMRDVNANQQINDNSVKYVISQQAIDRACLMAAHHPVDESDIRQLNEDYPHENPNYRGIENDMVAFIRNERQILYYYGYFHSKSTGATDFEFSSLTPIGELALKANAIEFLTIWEHQKIKMISQPATAEIKQLTTVDNSPEQFGISFHPYTDILGHLVRRETLPLDCYKYIVSRKKHSFSEAEWEQDESNIINHLNDIKICIDHFGRQRDRADEDSRKELLKYILGIRSDIPHDYHRNPLNLVKFDNSTVQVTDLRALNLLYGVYTKINQYKVDKYGQLFRDSENDLKRRYMAKLNGEDLPMDGQVKIFWDLYNIHPDHFILISTAVVISAILLGMDTVENMSRENVDQITEYLCSHFNGLFRLIGMRTRTSVKREILKSLNCLRDEDYSPYLNVTGEHNEQTVAEYRTENAVDIRERTERISECATVTPAEDRQRNITLVSLLKSYYLNCFAENNMLKCECCGDETFMTSGGEAYVEFHHLIPFGIAYGPDHYLNLFALCPNCHRKIHYLGADEKQECYEELNRHNYFHLCLTERLQMLKAQRLLRSYHLEYLLVDHAISLDEYNSLAA